MSAKQLDSEYEDKRIDSVTDEGSGFVICCDGWSLWLPKVNGIVPKVGDTARQYGRGIGSVVRGVDINGAEVFYRTEREQEAEEAKDKLERDLRQQQEYLANKDDYTARINALPGPLQKRLFQFRERDAEYGWKYEGYELACAEMAAAVATACERLPDGITVGDWLKRFHDAPWETQASIFGKAADGASGSIETRSAGSTPAPWRLAALVRGCIDAVGGWLGRDWPECSGA